MGKSVEAAARRCVPVFAALGDETRLSIVLRLLSEGTLSISQIAERSAVTRQAITKHLHVLASAGVVSNRRDGREQIWSLNPDQIDAARRALKGIVREHEDRR